MRMRSAPVGRYNHKQRRSASFGQFTQGLYQPVNYNSKSATSRAIQPPEGKISTSRAMHTGQQSGRSAACLAIHCSQVGSATCRAILSNATRDQQPIGRYSLLQTRSAQVGRCIPGSNPVDQQPVWRYIARRWDQQPVGRYCRMTTETSNQPGETAIFKQDQHKSGDAYWAATQ
jgi:hypothetical protein